MSTITPHLVVKGAHEASRWYQRALDAVEVGTIALPDGRLMQAELRFGDSTVMIADEFPDMGVLSPASLGGTYGALHLLVSDVDTVWQRALDAGASAHQPLADAFWGERYGQIIDPFGHRWGLAQHVREVPREAIQEAAVAAFGG